MSTEERPNKRLRSSENAPDVSQSPYTFRRGETWMDDGNVVLQSAPDKELVTTRFRMHWSVLCRYSTVFADMYSVPQPPEQDTVDGCPLVVLSDSAKDLATVLGALYDCYFNQEKLPIHVIDSMLRLGKKYNFTKLRSDAIRRLRHDWPTKLNGKWCNTSGFETVQPCHIFEVIRVAFEHGVNVVLPTLLYEVLTSRHLPMDIIYDGEEEKDNTYHLPSDLVPNCAKAYGRYLESQRSVMLDWLDDSGPIATEQCLIPTSCEEARGKLAAIESSELSGSWCFSLDCWNNFKWDDKLCKYCLEAAKAELDKERKAFWEKLPSLFNLGTWEEVERLSELE